jgi:hypothetical protein
MSIFQGSALPSVTTTQTAQQTAPEYYTNYLSNLAQFGQQQLGLTPDKLVAGPSALQTQAFQQAPSTLAAYQAPMSTAQGALGQLAGGVGASDISKFFNPFESKVMDEMSRRSQENVQRNLMPQMKAAFVGSGGLGGQRYAGATSQALADVQADLLGKQASVGMSGYQQALDAAMKEKGLMGSAAQIGGQLASQAGALGTGALTAMSQLGAQQQAIEQAKLSAPMMQAQNVAKLMQGYAIPTGTTQTTTRPGQQGEFGLSPLAQIGTLGGLIGSVARPEGNLSYIGDWLKNLFTQMPTTDMYGNPPGTGSAGYIDESGNLVSPPNP